MAKHRIVIELTHGVTGRTAGETIETSPDTMARDVARAVARLVKDTEPNAKEK